MTQHLKYTTQHIYPKLIAFMDATRMYKLPINWNKVAVLVKKHNHDIREVKRILPRELRSINFAKHATLIGQKITLGENMNQAVQDRLTKAKGSWKLIKRRDF